MQTPKLKKPKPPTPNIPYLQTNIDPIQPNPINNPRIPDINNTCGIGNDQETAIHPEEQSALADAYLQKLIDQGFNYAQSVEAFTFSLRVRKKKKKKNNTFQQQKTRLKTKAKKKGKKKKGRRKNTGEHGGEGKNNRGSKEERRRGGKEERRKRGYEENGGEEED